MPETIVCVSTMMWDGLPTRKQRFMRYLADRGHRVLYVEPPLSVFAPIRQSELVSGVRLRPVLETTVSGLHVLRAGLGLPGAGGRVAWLQDVRYRRHYAAIRRALRSLGLAPTVHWTYTFESLPFVGTLGERLTVFDCVDDLAHYPGIASDRAERMQTDLVRRSGLVLTPSSGLGERWRALNSNTHVIPNGYDPALLELPRPVNALSEIAQVVRDRLGERPIALFVGGIYEWIDVELLSRCAERLPELGFVIAGPSGKGVDVSSLRSLRNVLLPGRVREGEVADLLSMARVCLNPFRPGPLTDSVTPLKVYEYLAAGRPCVTTPMKELAPLRDVIVEADSVERFVESVREVAETPDTEAQRAARREAVADRAWPRLCERAETLMLESL